MAMYYPPMPENKTPIIIVLAVIGVGIWLYYRGKKEGKTDFPDVDYKTGTQEIPKSYNPNLLADELFDVLDRTFATPGEKEDAFQKMYYLPNDDLKVLVYNTFNKKYSKKAGMTLTKWIDSELVFNWGASVRKPLIAKLRSLNCK
ncbi:hypothetical protein IDJ77_11220 [Mucilaginibacter sp. ZT4R22]|uniref:Uncharacterized protein n=1 Tax=Mucilaginibacter pankratovii TaxID=2772110 RepID=A0ABR7WPY4_9SPHI|nr:hypothetical protein [Mucilaginibacter pankratovii]MBD1364379.1 hypothetical protein [Mucilaginibacter pankratovii]